MDKTIAMSLCLLCGIISPGAETPLKASWIWLKGADVHSYNQAVVARKEFRLAKPGPAALRITADSFYRLFINGNWVNDGPARSLPEHFQDDVIDATPFLVDGAKEIHIVARYFGVGDFHRVPQQAGLLAQLDVQLTSGLVDGASLRLAKTKLLLNQPRFNI